MRRQLAVGILAVLCGCRNQSLHSAEAGTQGNASTPAPSAALASAAPKVRQTKFAAERLSLGQGDEAILELPFDAVGRRPILVAVHGAGDRPDWACGGWRAIAEGYPFIICPQGSPGGGVYWWRSWKDLERIVDRSLAIVKERYADFVADGPIVLVGFSMGASNVAVLASKRSSDFPFVALVEGAYDTGGAFANPFAKSGGKRVLLSCSTGNCEGRFASARASIARAHIDVRVSDSGRHGHNLDKPEAMREPFAWLVRDDSRWAGLPAAKKLEAQP